MFISADVAAHDLDAHFSNLAKSLPPANTGTVHEPPDRLTPFRKKDTVIYYGMIHLFNAIVPQNSYAGFSQDPSYLKIYIFHNPTEVCDTMYKCK